MTRSKKIDLSPSISTEPLPRPSTLLPNPESRQVGGTLQREHRPLNPYRCGRTVDPVDCVDKDSVQIVNPSDPEDMDSMWHIRCLKKQLDRQELCSYLFFLNTAELREWERNDMKRLGFLKTWASDPERADPPPIEDVLRIVCNHGGALALILKRLESRPHWDDKMHYATDPVDVSSLPPEHLAGPANSWTPDANAEHWASMIIWLIKENSAQFPRSFAGEAGFWYYVEDVNRAYWYLQLLHRTGDCGTDVGCLSRTTIPFSNVPGEGTWYNADPVQYSEFADDPQYILWRGPQEAPGRSGNSGRSNRSAQVPAPRLSSTGSVNTPSPELRKSSHPPRLSPACSPSSASINTPAPLGTAATSARNTSVVSESGPRSIMEEQLLSLHLWVYTTYPDADEDPKLDDLFDRAQQHIRYDNENDFMSVRLDIKSHCWKKNGMPDNDATASGLKQLRALQGWVYERMSNPDGDERIFELFMSAVEAVKAADVHAFNRTRAEVRMSVGSGRMQST